MSWLLGATSNEELVSNLKAFGTIKHARVEQAMLAVDRAMFCSQNPYMDSPQPIGACCTLSAAA